LYLLADQLDWMLGQGGLDWAVKHGEEAADLVYGWAEASGYASPFVREPARRSRTVATIDLDESLVDAKQVSAVLRANGVVDTESYRKLGRNQLRFGLFPDIELDDLATLTRAVDFVVDALASARPGSTRE
jgi:phosphoserine aminotransferase